MNGSRLGLTILLTILTVATPSPAGEVEHIPIRHGTGENWAIAEIDARFAFRGIRFGTRIEEFEGNKTQGPPRHFPGEMGLSGVPGKRETMVRRMDERLDMYGIPVEGIYWFFDDGRLYRVGIVQTQVEGIYTNLSTLARSLWSRPSPEEGCLDASAAIKAGVAPPPGCGKFRIEGNKVSVIGNLLTPTADKHTWTSTVWIVDKAHRALVEQRDGASEF